MNRLIQFAVTVLLIGTTAITAQAGFSSLYVFGDGLSATADLTAPGAPYFYGQRWSNGRVWVEVLAQRQGLTYTAANNNSYFNHNSTLTLVDVNAFVPPANVANDLFVVWVCNSDTYDEATAGLPLTLLQWQVSNSLSAANHLQIIKALYAKGVRTLIMPNAVDLSKIPAFNAGSLTATEHAGCIDYNTQFANIIAQARAQCPGLTIYTPDFYTLLNNALTNAVSYGLTNALSTRGYSIDAYDDPTITTLTLNGQGANYIFWDSHDPTAKFHAVMADVVQQIVSPVWVSNIAVLNGSNRLDVVNVPIGLNGYVETCTNIWPANWWSVTNFASASATLSVYVPQPVTATTNVSSAFSSGKGTQISSADSGGGGLLGGPTPPYIMNYYRLHFPYAWNWP